MAMQGARAGDLFRLQLARSLAPQGNPTTPLAALGNLGRLAASLYMQQNVAKGIEDRRTAADRAALAALQGTRQPIYAPRPTVGDVDLSPPSPGIPTAQIGERRVGPDRAALISILSNPDASENISKLAGTLFAEQISADQSALDRDFQRDMQKTRLSAAEEQKRADRNLQERLAQADRTFRADQGDLARRSQEDIAQLNREAQIFIAQGADARSIRVALINAAGAQNKTPNLVRYAERLFPGDKEAQDAFIYRQLNITNRGVNREAASILPTNPTAPTTPATNAPAPTAPATNAPAPTAPAPTFRAPERTSATDATGLVDRTVAIGESILNKAFGKEAPKQRMAERVGTLRQRTLRLNVTGRDGRPSNFSDKSQLNVLPDVGFNISDDEYLGRLEDVITSLDRELASLASLARDAVVPAETRSNAARDFEKLTKLRNDWLATIGATSDAALPGGLDPEVEARAMETLRLFDQRAKQ